ncbi:MAG: hypothetical protein ACYCQI_06610 [Gammaproteobacteria bacterium]
MIPLTEIDAVEKYQVTADTIEKDLNSILILKKFVSRLRKNTDTNLR